MKTWFRGLLFPLSLIVLFLVAATAGLGDVRETEPFVFEPTMTFFWNLASLQVRNPAVASRLLRTDPLTPRSNLASLEVGIEKYESLVAASGVSPVILFLPRDADPAREARRHRLTVASWPELAPPALLSGPEVDTLVIFVPILRDDRTGRGRGASALNRELSQPVPRSARFLSARDPKKDPLENRIYSVAPYSWHPSVKIEHTRCGHTSPDVQLVTKLTYGGGSTDSEFVQLSRRDWKPCRLASDPELRAAVVSQTSRSRAGRPVIIAGSYFQDPFPGPLLAKWIRVK